MNFPNRIAPSFLPIIYKKGDAEDWVRKLIRRKELKGSTFETKMMRAARMLDAEIKDSRGDPVKSRTGEKSCRTLYGHYKGLVHVGRRSH